MTGQLRTTCRQTTWYLGLLAALLLASACGGRGAGDAASGGASSSSSETASRGTSSSSSESPHSDVCSSDPSAVLVKAIAIGNLHTCILTTSGGVRCWGDNTYGQLGDDMTDGHLTPTTIGGLSGVSAIAAGGAHTCVLTTSGGVRCWGNNANGQLGDGTSTKCEPPPSTDVLSGVSAIAAGYEHTCALMATGGVRCWGGNTYGQLGDSSATNEERSSPLPTDALGNVFAIATGFVHTCALMKDGTVQCWGSNDKGQLGSTTKGDKSMTPLGIKGLGDVSAIAAGSAHTCALMKDGTIQCWGSNDKGQLAVGGPAEEERLLPSKPDALDGDSVIAAGWEHTCAVMTNGGVRCWGANDEGQLGGSTTTDSPTPPDADVPNLPSVKTIAAGRSHTCAVTKKGGVRCWGANDKGQLGSGTTGDHSTPAVPKGLCSD